MWTPALSAMVRTLGSKRGRKQDKETPGERGEDALGPVERTVKTEPAEFAEVLIVKFSREKTKVTRFLNNAVLFSGRETWAEAYLGG